jgi:hypothetical protein
MEHGGSLNGQVNQLGPPHRPPNRSDCPPLQVRFTHLPPER